MSENDYQKKMQQINEISPSICAAKWYDATIWLYSGLTASCHHPPSHKIDIEEIKKNPSAIHNTSHKKEMRKLMQDGKRPKECDYCWRIEDLSPNNVSDRFYKSLPHSIEEIKQLATTSWQSDVPTKTLEIAFDRTCNFSCMYCNPSFSTSWVRDIQKSGPYQNLPTDGRNHYTHTHEGSDPFNGTENNPYVEAFWKWWPELKKSLKQLRITGGEPLLSPHFWRLLESFKEDGNESIRLAVNSNLGSRKEIIQKLITASHSVRHLEIFTSNEGAGPEAEYIRDGLNYELWKSNFEDLMTNGNVKRIHLMMTINGLCLFSITKLLDQCLEWKKKFGPENPTMSFNLVRWPAFQSPLALSKDLRQETAGRLETWYKKNNSNLLNGYEKGQIVRLIDYLKNAEAASEDAAPQKDLAKDLREFLSQYDKRRGKSFEKCFEPMLVNWLKEVDA